MTTIVTRAGKGSALTHAEMDGNLTALRDTADAAATGGALTTHTGNTANPHAVTKAQVGLGSVDNTADTAKPVSTAQATAIGEAITAHTAAMDPHPQYLTPDDGNALYAPIGTTGVTNLAATASPTGVTITSDTGTDAEIAGADAANAGAMLPAHVTKLAGIATGATANATDAQLRDRTTHTGEQGISTVTGLQTALDGKATAAQGAKADTALQPGMQLTQAAVTGATAAGVALLDAADAVAQRTALGLGTAATTAASAYATAAQGVKADAALPATADAIADVLEAAATGAPADLARIQASVSGYLVAQSALVKSNKSSPAFSVVAGNLVVGQNITVIVPGGIKKFLGNAAITAPSYVAGMDYVVTCDGTTLTIAEYRTGGDVIGGVHYSAANGLVELSVWDINYRPECINPRGMVQALPGVLWADIYPCAADHFNGTSIYGVNMAGNTNRPLLPLAYGGNGITTVAPSWYAANDVGSSHGKRLATWQEYGALAAGAATGYAAAADPVTTQSIASARSTCGAEMVTGCRQAWASTLATSTASGGWKAITQGKGQVYIGELYAPLVGGHFGAGSAPYNGPRAADWSSRPDFSSAEIAFRFVCGHRQI